MSCAWIATVAFAPGTLSVAVGAALPLGFAVEIEAIVEAAS